MQQDPDAQPFHSEATCKYVAKVTPLWTAFLQMPMFEVMVETPGALWSGVHRTVASVLKRVQAQAWILPLGAGARQLH